MGHQSLKPVCMCTHAKCCCRLWLLSTTLRTQEKREDKEWKRDQSNKQIHILIGQGLCLLFEQ